MPGKMTKTAMQVSGVVELVIGIGIFIWARAHSPNMGFGEMLTKADSFILKEPVYYAVLGIAALFAIGGIINVVKSLGADGKTALNVAKSLTGQDTGLEKIKKAKELLDAGAIDAAEFAKIKKEALGD